MFTLIATFYGGMLFGILVMALCVSASDQRKHHPRPGLKLTLITVDPHTGQPTSERTVILPHAHAEN